MEQCDASVSYDTQLLVAHFSPLDLKIATFLGSNLCMGLNFNKNSANFGNLVISQLLHLCQVLRFKTITITVLIVDCVMIFSM